MSASKLGEIVSRDNLETAQSELLSRKINELSLKIQGTHLEALISQLYQELEQAGISFRPKTYLSDEWGCPHRVPVIGIPFYLASQELHLLEGQLTGEEAEDEEEVMMYLRHEAGHAFNYAYRLYTKPEWSRLFGLFSLPYQEDYKASPFSPRFVHHIPGWYAQKHPDEDFAETFAVWLTPDSHWREVYADSLALTKLLYVERVAHRYGQQPPTVTVEELDTPVQELTMTLDEWYKKYHDTGQSGPALHPVINEDLRRLFPGIEGQPAGDVLETHRRLLIRDVHYWTAMDRHILRSLFNELQQRVNILGLKIDVDQTSFRMVSVAVFLTTLAMNYQRTGQFMEV